MSFEPRSAVQQLPYLNEHVRVLWKPPISVRDGNNRADQVNGKETSAAMPGTIVESLAETAAITRITNNEPRPGLIRCFAFTLSRSTYISYLQ